MRFLHISADDSGGAGRATYNLHNHFKTYGHDSKVVVLNRTIYDKDVLQYSPILLQKMYYKLFNLIYKKKTDGDYYFLNVCENTLCYTSVKELIPDLYTPDAIIIHWVSGFINSKNIYELSNLSNKPILWYGLDMAPLTGGCHYAWDCEGYLHDCGHCPALFSSKKKDLSYYNLKQKKKFLSKTNIKYIAVNSYIEEQAKKSALFRDKPIKKIFLAINPNVYKPLNKFNVRDILEIQRDKFVILIGSFSIGEKRKGFEYLVEAFNIFSNLLAAEQREKVMILIMGYDNNNYSSLIPFEKKRFGYVKDDFTMTMLYNAANIFVSSSIEDTGPMMINESVMCGTPVVSFKMGVAIDLVKTGITGYLANLKDSRDLANGIKYMFELEESRYRLLSDRCRDLAIQFLHPEIQVNSFIDILNDK
ncbi:MAG: glycosyltransferase [Thermoplasmata archaeon]